MDIKNILKKVKVKTVAIGLVTAAGVYYGGKKAIKHIKDLGSEPEPLTDEEIKRNLGIGTNVIYDEKESS